jgi:hypothetical protein
MVRCGRVVNGKFKLGCLKHLDISIVNWVTFGKQLLDYVSLESKSYLK